MRIAILIVNWNGFDDTKACLASLTKHCKDADVLLLENGSGQEGMLREILDERTELIVSEENLGFGGGNNILIKNAMERGYDFVYLLNNDTEVTEGFLDEPVRLMEDPKVGFVNSKLILIGSGKIDTAGHWHLNSGDVVPAGRGRPASEFSKNRVILSGCAAGLLLRVKMLEDIGLFREEFFLGYEDVDLTYRASVMGWKGIYCAESIVDHSLNAAIGKIRSREYYVRSQRNSNLAYLYNTPAAVMALNMPWIIMKYLMVIAFSLASGYLAHAKVHFIALGNVFREFRGVFRVRKQILCRRKLTTMAIWSEQRMFIPAYLKLDKSLTRQMKNIV
jgi:GT2 family glycosyltransferase